MNKRLKFNCAGEVVLRLMSLYQDGTIQVEISPLEFTQWLVHLRLVFSVAQ